jgi:phenylacetate-CoA ligase
VPHIAWPALPTSAGAQMLAMQWQLEQSQWWPRERLIEHQFRQIRKLVAHAVAQVPYYKSALDVAGVENPSALTEASFRRWPILKKSQVRAHEALLCAAGYPKAHGATLEGETTGSTGMPVRVRRTEIDALFGRALVVREHLMHGRDFRRKFGTIRAGVAQSAQPGWGLVNVAFETGPGCAISLNEPIERLLAWLLQERPNYLLVTPAVLRELILLSTRRGIAPQGLAHAMTFAAMHPSGLRLLAREAWGIGITDSYSCVEAGNMAVECPGHDHYLVHAENVYLEVLRDDGSPCAPGETGRVVITALHNFAMPLIRYELGDYAELGGDCPTGRGLPTLNRIAGRVRNMLRDPTGRMASPNLSPSLLLETAPIVQYRIVQHSLLQLQFQYVMERELTAAEGARLIAGLQADLGYPFGIQLSRMAEIERQKGGKFEEFLSLLPESGA